MATQHNIQLIMFLLSKEVIRNSTRKPNSPQVLNNIRCRKLHLQDLQHQEFILPFFYMALSSNFHSSFSFLSLYSSGYLHNLSTVDFKKKKKLSKQFCSHHIHNWDIRLKTDFQFLIMSDGPVISKETCYQSTYITHLSVALSCPHLLGETTLSDRTRETAAVSAAITLRYTMHH